MEKIKKILHKIMTWDYTLISILGLSISLIFGMGLSLVLKLHSNVGKNVFYCILLCAGILVAILAIIHFISYIIAAVSYHVNDTEEYQRMNNTNYNEEETGNSIEAQKFPDIISAPIDGKVVKTYIEDWTKVKKGDELLLISLHGKEYIISAPKNGTIKHMYKRSGDSVKRNDIIAYYYKQK